MTDNVGNMVTNLKRVEPVSHDISHKLYSKNKKLAKT